MKEQGKICLPNLMARVIEEMMMGVQDYLSFVDLLLHHEGTLVDRNNGILVV